jgi:hypothetical protein
MEGERRKWKKSSHARWMRQIKRQQKEIIEQRKKSGYGMEREWRRVWNISNLALRRVQPDKLLGQTYNSISFDSYLLSVESC